MKISKLRPLLFGLLLLACISCSSVWKANGPISEGDWISPIKLELDYTELDINELFERLPKRLQSKRNIRIYTEKPNAPRLLLRQQLSRKYGNGITNFIRSADLKDVLGSANARNISSEIDFETHYVIYLNWYSGGPPFGDLLHETKLINGCKSLVFYVSHPAYGKIRKSAARRFQDFYKVPKGVCVTLDRKERPVR